MIPQVDLAAQHREIAPEVDAGFASVMARRCVGSCHARIDV